MNVEIITIGDELLIGQVVDTNSAWMGQELNKYGFSTERITTISDTSEAITQALDSALEHASIVLISGGIGPTKDDRTKQTLATYFNSPLIKHEASYQNIEKLFSNRKIVINDLTKQQAWVPQCCKVFINTAGTAPIMWFEKNNKIIVSMPGVPHEMKEAMSTQILPQLAEKYKLTPVMHLTLWVANTPESLLALQIEDFENNLPPEASLAYLPTTGMVRLRISVKSNNEEQSKQLLKKLKEQLTTLLKDKIVGENDWGPSRYFGQLLLNKGWTLGTAESCTGGSLAQEITSYAGCSAYYKGSVVAYSNEVKESTLHVNPQTLVQHGAVSQFVVEEMAKGALKTLNCNVALATSGIAGPDGGTDEKPVGTIWIAAATKNLCLSKELRLGQKRHTNIERTCTEIWELLFILLNQSR